MQETKALLYDVRIFKLIGSGIVELQTKALLEKKNV